MLYKIKSSMDLTEAERTIAEFVISNEHLVLDANAKNREILQKLLQRPGFDFQKMGV